MYHRISDVKLENNQYLTISKANFETQIKYFKRKYKILSFEESWKLPFYKTGIVFSFDDGYANFYNNALPILKKHNIPALLFPVTSHLESKDYFWWDKLVLIYEELPDLYYLPNKEQLVNKKSYNYSILHDLIKNKKTDYIEKWLKKIMNLNNLSIKFDDEFRSLNISEIKKISSSNLIKIGGHTHTHFRFSATKKMEFISDVKKNTTILEKITSKKIDIFAYPYGDHNQLIDSELLMNQFNYLFLANDYYSNHFFKSKKIISRILITDIIDNELINRLRKFN